MIALDDRVANTLSRFQITLHREMLIVLHSIDVIDKPLASDPSFARMNSSWMENTRGRDIQHFLGRRGWPLPSGEKLYLSCVEKVVRRARPRAGLRRLAPAEKKPNDSLE